MKNGRIGNRREDSTQYVARIALECAVVTLLIIMLLVVPRPQPGHAAPTEVTPLPPVTQTGDRLGTCYAFLKVNGTTLAPIAHAAGSRWDRFDFRWNVIEREKAQMSFDAHDTVVNRDIAAGINIVGILGSTPAWATTNCPVSAASPPLPPMGHPTRPSSATPLEEPYWWRPCPPDNLDLRWDHPDNYWGHFVYQTVLHFKDRVHVWEIWNEPDLGATYWSGTPQQYAQLLRVAYQAVKAADPDAKVLFAGLAYWYNPTYYITVLDALRTLPDAPEHNYYFDVMSLHLYSSVYTIRPVVSGIRANMASRVGQHPIWLTEAGVSVWDETPNPPEGYKINRARAEEAASYVIEAFAEARAIGVDKFFFFRTNDDGMTTPEGLPEKFGLLRDDLTYRPAYVAYQVAAQYLYGENQITGPFTNANARRITFWGTPHGRVDVLWNVSGTPITIRHPAVLPTATWVNQRGETGTLTAVNGAYTLTLEAATANTAEDGSFLIGGPPLLVIQTDLVPPTSALHPLPTAVYTRNLTLAWDTTDDASGTWYVEIERATTPSGPWTRVAGWADTRGLTHTTVILPSSATWYFRARARDNVGNWENWPPSAEVSTTAHLTRTVTLSVTTYFDANSNGTWEQTDPAEDPIPGTTLRWIANSGTVISHTVGVSWHVTETVDIGAYQLIGYAPDALLPPQKFNVEGGPDPLTINLLVGLHPVKGRAFLPLLLRAYSP